jgi:hypothetical protein
MTRNLASSEQVSVGVGWAEPIMLLTMLIVLTGPRVITSLELGSSSKRGGSRRGNIESGKRALNVGLILPLPNFLKKNYDKNIGAAVSNIEKNKYMWSNTFSLSDAQVHLEMMSINPSPTGSYLTVPRLLPFKQ